jgi:hypothetical protein
MVMQATQPCLKCDSTALGFVPWRRFRLLPHFGPRLEIRVFPAESPHGNGLISLRTLELCFFMAEWPERHLSNILQSLAYEKWKFLSWREHSTFFGRYH